MPVVQTRRGIGEKTIQLARNMDYGILEEAAKAGVNLSRFLEQEDPSEDYEDGLDAFERQLMYHKIKTRSYPADGIVADKFGEFNKGGQATRALAVEFIHRAWRRAIYGPSGSRSFGMASGNRALYASDDYGVGTAMRPYVDAAQERYQKLQPAIPISELVAITTPIDGDTYRSVYLEDETEEERLVRVGEGDEIPGAKLKSHEQTVRIHKYGRKLKTTYEQLRHVKIDMIAFHIARMAIRSEVDKVAAIIEVLASGDGNDNPADVINLTELDADATAGTITVKAWLAFKMLFENPYAITHALTKSDIALQLMLLNMGSANIPLVNLQTAAGFGGITPINPELRDNVRLGWTGDAPTDKVVGFDGRSSIERITEIGSSITESQNWIENQTRVLTMTESEGYSKLDEHGVKILDVAA